MRTDIWNDRARPWPVRPAVGFLHPLEVLKDQDLDPAEKRELSLIHI